VADADDMQALFQTAADRFGGVDVIVNAAGIMPLAPIAEMDLDTFDWIQRINVRGAFVVCQLAARMIRDGGTIITFVIADKDPVGHLWRVHRQQGGRRGEDARPGQGTARTRCHGERPRSRARRAVAASEA
jgi:NAD(P)-dependent dehydrogenase (short-subunit alcohol dehydrogenase family)